MNTPGSRREQQPGFAEFVLQAAPGEEAGMPTAGAAAVEGAAGGRLCVGGFSSLAELCHEHCWRHFWRWLCTQLEIHWQCRTVW